MQLIEYSAQSNDLAAPLNSTQLHIQREHQRLRSFQLPLKSKTLAPFTTRVHVSVREEKHNALKGSLLSITDNVMI